MYQPPDMSRWTGRVDYPRSVDTQRWHSVMQALDMSGDIPAAKSGTRCYALLGFCCDEGVRRNLGRTGAREAPAFIRRSLCNLAFHWDDVILYDAGDVICRGQKMEAAQAMRGCAVYKLFTPCYKRLVAGCDDEDAYGTYTRVHPCARSQGYGLGIQHLDANFDRRQYE